MRDPIERQDAIDALEREKTYCSAFREGYSKTDIFEKYNMGLTDGIKAIKNIPSAQPEQRWIPCSERLPEIKEHYTSEPCIVYCDNKAYAFAELEENIFGQVGWNCERDDDYHEAVGTVIAWMPLPEPYTERRGE